MLRELGKKAKSINVQEIALQVAKANEGLIPKRVREQLTVGENAKEQNVGTYKSDRYAKLKQSMGSQAPFRVPDLKLSGKLHKQLFVEINTKGFEVDSKVDYSKYQIQRYGNEIYGLQKEAQKDIQHRNSVDIVKAYSERLGL
jgi:hypothetical protein